MLFDGGIGDFGWEARVEGYEVGVVGGEDLTVGNSVVRVGVLLFVPAPDVSNREVGHGFLVGDFTY